MVGAYSGHCEILQSPVDSSIVLFPIGCLVLGLVLETYPTVPALRATSEAAMKIMKRPPQWVTMEAGGWRSDHDHASLALQRRSGGQARVWRTLLQNCTVHIPYLHCWDRDGTWYRVSLRTFVADCFFKKWKYQNQWYSIHNQYWTIVWSHFCNNHCCSCESLAGLLLDYLPKTLHY